MWQTFYGSDSEGCIPVEHSPSSFGARKVHHYDEFDQATGSRESVRRPASMADVIDNESSTAPERLLEFECLVESWLRWGRDSAMDAWTTTSNPFLEDCTRGPVESWFRVYFASAVDTHQRCLMPIVEDRVGFIERAGFILSPGARRLLDSDLQLTISAKDVVSSIKEETKAVRLTRPMELDAFLDPEVTGPEILRIVVYAPEEMDWREQMNWWDRLSDKVRSVLPTKSLRYRIVISVEPATGGDGTASAGVH